MTVVDVDSLQLASPLFCGGNGIVKTHCLIRDCHVARVVGIKSDLESDKIYSDWHSIAISIWNPSTIEISRLTLEDSGSFADGSRGTGALTFLRAAPRRICADCSHSQVDWWWED